MILQISNTKFYVTVNIIIGGNGRKKLLSMKVLHMSTMIQIDGERERARELARL